jgi:hypothetical protein
MKLGMLLTAGVIGLTLLSMPRVSLAHSGGTDSAGGHRDNQNSSGLGPYHYHHGMGPHLHQNGVCPFASGSAPASSASGGSPCCCLALAGAVTAAAYLATQKR